MKKSANVHCLLGVCVQGQHMVVFQIPGLKFIMPRGKGIQPRRRRRLPGAGGGPLASSSPEHQQACDHLPHEDCRFCHKSDGDEPSDNANELDASGQVIWGWNSGFSTGFFLGHFPA